MLRLHGSISDGITDKRGVFENRLEQPAAHVIAGGDSAVARRLPLDTDEMTTKNGDPIRFFANLLPEGGLPGIAKPLLFRIDLRS